jgi:ribosomal protein L37E
MSAMDKGLVADRRVCPPAPTWPTSDTVLQGELGWYVPDGHTFCPRCGDQNWNEHRLCITCTHGDSDYRDGEFRRGWLR